MIYGLQTAIFVPEPFSVTSTTEACSITRVHRGFKCELLGPLRSCGHTETGVVAQQRVKVVDHQGDEHIFRRVRIKLNGATRDGATIVHILTNLPCRVSATGG